MISNSTTEGTIPLTPDVSLMLQTQYRVFDGIIAECLLICLVIGLPGNALSLVYFIKTRSRNLPNLLYMTVCSVDMVTCLIHVPVTINLLNKRDPGLLGNEYFCGVWYFTLLIVQQLSVFVVMVISITRTIVITFPFYQINKNLVFTSILVTFLYHTIWTAVRFLGGQYYYSKGFGYCDFYRETLTIPYRINYSVTIGLFPLFVFVSLVLSVLGVRSRNSVWNQVFSTGLGNQNRAGVGNQNFTGRGNQNCTGLGNKNRAGLGNQNRAGLGNQNRAGLGNQNRTGFENQNRTGFENQNRTVFENQNRTGFENQNRTGFENQNRTGFENPNRTGLENPNRTGLGTSKLADLSQLRKRESSVTMIYFTVIFLICNFFTFLNNVVYIASIASGGVDNYPGQLYSNTFMFFYSWLISEIVCTVINAALNPVLYFCRMRRMRCWVLRVLKLRNSKIVAVENQRLSRRGTVDFQSVVVDKISEMKV